MKKQIKKIELNSFFRTDSQGKLKMVLHHFKNFTLAIDENHFLELIPGFHIVVQVPFELVPIIVKDLFLSNIDL